MSRGKVQMSIPVIAQWGDYEDIVKAHGYLSAQFSPDGRYLSFLTPGYVVKNADGWPFDVDLTGPSLAVLNLLDLQEKKIV